LHDLVHKEVALVRIVHRHQTFLKERLESCSKKMHVHLTPFILPLLIVSVGLSTMNSPSTTGTNVNVP
jgi:hypothetical protein